MTESVVRIQDNSNLGKISTYIFYKPYVVDTLLDCYG